MFLNNPSNRIHYDVAGADGSAGGGAANDDIILSGQDDGGAGTGGAGTGGTQTPEEIEAARVAAEAAAAAAAAGTGGGSGGTSDLVDIDDKTDVYIKDVLSNKYSDLSTVKLNATGDVVNSEGTVLISKDDLEKSTGELKTERIGLADKYIKSLKVVTVTGEDGKDVELPISEDGSVKDANGEVIYTAEQLREQVMAGDDYLKDPEEFTSIYDEAAAISGIEIVDEQGNPITFDETPDGMARRDIHIARQEGARIANEQISNFFTQNPQLEDAFYYLKANGNLDGFGTQTNHEGVTIDDTNTQQHIDLIVEAEMMRGLSKEAAVKRAKIFSDNDMAQEEAKSALLFMQAKEKADKQANIDAYNKAQDDAIKEQEAYWGKVQNIVSTGRVLDYTIPENIRVPMPDGTIAYRSRDDFYNYMSVPLENGLTAAQIDAQNEPLETKIFNDFLRFVNNDMSYIVNQKVNQKAVSSFKERFTTGGIPNKNRLVIKKPTKRNNDNINI